jgi:hypothetical protein
MTDRSSAYVTARLTTHNLSSLLHSLTSTQAPIITIQLNTICSDKVKVLKLGIITDNRRIL